MATLDARLLALEHTLNTAPMLTMEVQGPPTDEQAAQIERCARAGRRLMVFCEPGNTAWMPGCGSPPWEAEHGNA